MKYSESVARKDLVCDLCGKRIDKGSPYARMVSDQDDWNAPTEDLEYGPHQVFERHIDCNKAWKMISDLFGDGDSFCYFYDGGTREMVLEQLTWNEINPTDFGDPDLVRAFLIRLGLTEKKALEDDSQ